MEGPSRSLYRLSSHGVLASAVRWKRERSPRWRECSLARTRARYFIDVSVQTIIITPREGAGCGGFSLETKLAEVTRARRQKNEEWKREWKRDDGKWRDDAECAIKYFYGPQGQGRRIVIERNNYFTRLSLRLSLSLCASCRVHLHSKRLWLNGDHILFPSSPPRGWIADLEIPNSPVCGRGIELISLRFKHS